MGEEDDQADEKSSIEAKKTTRKIIRVITVIAYLCSVSMAAIMLSLYYLFFWNPTVRAGPEKLVDPIQLPLTQFYSKTQGDSLNYTFPSMEREEPRALPVQAFDDVFQSDNEGVDGNFSLFYGNENRTILNKIIKLFKTL